MTAPSSAWDSFCQHQRASCSPGFPPFCAEPTRTRPLAECCAVFKATTANSDQFRLDNYSNVLTRHSRGRSSSQTSTFVLRIKSEMSGECLRRSGQSSSTTVTQHDRNSGKHETLLHQRFETYVRALVEQVYRLEYLRTSMYSCCTAGSHRQSATWLMRRNCKRGMTVFSQTQTQSFSHSLNIASASRFSYFMTRTEICMSKNNCHQ